MYKITFKGNTDTGKVRSNNEDSYIVENIWDNNHILGVVIDGVGGYDGGEIASGIARKTIIEYLEKYPDGERIDLLKQAVVEANNKIVEERDIQKQFANMSCVLTACLIETERKQLNMVHVGDTRLYQYHNSTLKKLSHDHSLVGYREEKGDLTEEEAMNHPQRNIIGRDVGSEQHQVDDKDFLEAESFPVLANSTFLLCSDGLSDMLTSAEIVSVLQQDISLEKRVEELIGFANKKGGKDNITVVLIDYISDEPEANKSENKKDSTPEIKNMPDRPTPGTENTETIPKSGNSRTRTILLFLFLFILGLAAGWFARDIYVKTQKQKTNSTNPEQTVIFPDETVNNATDTVTPEPLNDNHDPLSIADESEDVTDSNTTNNNTEENTQPLIEQ